MWLIGFDGDYYYLVLNLKIRIYIDMTNLNRPAYFGSSYQ